MDSTFLEVVVGVLSYAVLAAAILKAREISPRRMLLQPRVVFSAVAPSPSDVKTEQPQDAAPAEPNVTPATHGVNETPRGSAPGLATAAPQLRIGTKLLVVAPGLRILEHQAVGLFPQTVGGPVAEVTRNPQDPSVLGLTNLSNSPWEITTPRGNRHQISTGQTMKLSVGTKIDFGVLDGEVR